MQAFHPYSSPNVCWWFIPEVNRERRNSSSCGGDVYPPCLIGGGSTFSVDGCFLPNQNLSQTYQIQWDGSTCRRKEMQAQLYPFCLIWWWHLLVLDNTQGPSSRKKNKCCSDQLCCTLTTWRVKQLLSTEVIFVMR